MCFQKVFFMLAFDDRLHFCNLFFEFPTQSFVFACICTAFLNFNFYVCIPIPLMRRQQAIRTFLCWATPLTAPLCTWAVPRSPTCVRPLRRVLPTHWALSATLVASFVATGMNEKVKHFVVEDYFSIINSHQTDRMSVFAFRIAIYLYSFYSNSVN
jgi:hypothetical protein